MPDVTIKPSSGGQLVTRISSSDATIANYLVKRNIRRDQDGEVTREGVDYLIMDHAAGDAAAQPFPAASNEPITLIHSSLRADGASALVVGTKTTLYRFNQSVSDYVASGYVASGYVVAGSRWEIIASGMSAQGNRWQAINLNGKTLFNNGVDLPQVFAPEWSKTRPLTQLREQGVARVGVIGEHNALPLVADISEIKADDLSGVTGMIKSNGITAYQTGMKVPKSVATLTGSTVTANLSSFVAGDVGRLLRLVGAGTYTIASFISATQVSVVSINGSLANVSTPKPVVVTDRFSFSSNLEDAYSVRSSEDFFEPEMVGQTIGWKSGASRKIVKYLGHDHVKVLDEQPIPQGEFQVSNPNALITYTGSVDRRRYRLLIGTIGDLEDWAVAYNVESTAGSRTLVVNSATLSLEVGDEVVVDGGGLDGAALALDKNLEPILVESVGPGYVTISAEVLNTNALAKLYRTSAVGSTVGYEDLEDDGSGILAIKKLGDKVMVYKDTNAFMGDYTGNASKPIVFSRIQIPHGQSLYFRHCIVEIAGSYHVYASKNALYSIDLTTRIPKPIPQADAMSNLFFDHARIADTEDIFFADNHVTKEVWINIPAAPVDKIICWDYLYNTASTTDISISSAATIKGANQQDDWFVMGIPTGTLLMNGRVTGTYTPWASFGGNCLYNRRTARPYTTARDSYESVIEPCFGDFGQAYAEKQITNYVLHLSSLQATSPMIRVEFRTKRNQSEEGRLIGAKVIGNAMRHGMVALHCSFHHIQDRIIATGKDSPVRISGRTFDIKGINTKSFSKQ